MRIALISAHFPPDFVSGGTLQPQRIARGLRSAGHDVRVLAGSLDPDRTPLSTWDDVDDSGLVVRWVASGPFIGWDDTRNYDNPGVTAVAAALFDEWRPDIVHAHALQGLGVGPLDAAIERGIPTVVTMHDFWWVCARQFLVDRDHRPCPVVVDASDCACQAGRAHLAVRDARLRTTLAGVAAVLVPSASAAEVLRANGVAPDRLAVDENGVPAPAPARRSSHWDRRAPAEPLVVRYAGGSNAMKGVDVLLDAAALLRRDLPLRVLAHGIDEALERRGSVTELPAIVETLPPYDPADLDDVLDATDVLVLPSVMRETFSIVTREALSRGVPVIATDTLGPEEVVHDGLNGLVLPAGDPHALAAALTALADDPDRVGGWRAATTGVALRSVGDQVTGLVARFESLTQGAPAPAPRGDERWPAQVVFVVGIDGAPLRYRAQIPAEALATLGIATSIHHYRDPGLASIIASASVVVVYRVPATPQVLDLLAGAHELGIPVAFDVDDLIFDPDLGDEIPALRLLPADEAALWLEGVQRYRTTLEACDAFIGSTDGLVTHAAAVVGLPALRFENGVGSLVAQASDRAARRPRAPGPLRVGFLSGTTTHDEDWASVEPAVLEALARHPTAELWLGGHLRTGPAVEVLGPRLHRLPFTRWDHLPDVLRDLDVNLAPLTPGSRFNDAKSAIKWLEAALCGTPTIASPSEPFRAAIEHRRTGWLAANHDEWVEGLDRLLTDEALRRAVGARAQRAALLRWSPHTQAERYRAVLGEVRQAAAVPRPASAWVAVVRDEPALPHPTALTPYALDDLGADPPPTDLLSRRATWAGTARRAVASLRHEGLPTAMARARRSLTHRWALRRAR